MQHDRLYTLETLNLAVLAEQLQLSEHQLSELINTELEQGFPRYIRQQQGRGGEETVAGDRRASVLSMAYGRFWHAVQLLRGVPRHRQHRPRAIPETAWAGGEIQPG